MNILRKLFKKKEKTEIPEYKPVFYNKQKIDYIVENIHKGQLQDRYEVFKKNWVKKYEREVDKLVESEDMNRVNKVEDMINEYCMMKYHQEFGVSYNDKKGNIEQRYKWRNDRVAVLQKKIEEIEKNKVDVDEIEDLIKKEEVEIENITV